MNNNIDSDSVISDNIDLSSLKNYSSILKLLEEENDNDKYSETCLISGEIINDTCVELECGHKFNYKHLLSEIVQQKKNKSINNWETTILRKYQIKCPYCRNVQNSLLPYLPGFPKIQKVNTPLNKTYMPHKCKYVFKRGVNKNKACDKKCYGDFCTTHYKAMLKKKNKHSK